MAIPGHEEEHSSSRNSSSSSNKWGPYSGAGEFSTNMVIILAILFCALLFALIIVAFIRIILSNRRNRRLIISSHNNSNNNKDVITSAVVLDNDLAPALTFSMGTKLAGVGAECAICLNEFVDGDGVRVLPACNHGFHVKCIEGWLVSHCSCPTCRRTCRHPTVENSPQLQMV